MGGYDGGVKLWDVSTGQELRTLVGTNQVFSPDGKILATVDSGYNSGEASIRLWDWRTGQELKKIQARPDIATHLAFSPKGEVLASTSFNPTTITLWDVSTGQQLRTLAGFTNVVTQVAFSPDGKVLASISGDDDVSGVEDAIKLWDWRTGQLFREIHVEAGSAAIMGTAFAFSPNGKTIAVTSYLGWEVTLWDDLGTGSARLTINVTKANVVGGVASIAFSPDGQMIAGNIKNQLKIWSAATGEELRTMEGYASQVSAIGLSADGALLASGNGDGTIRLWNLRQRQVSTLRGHTAPVEAVVFSPDGKTLASSDSNNTVKR
jgi:WD40 repeat protein